MLSFHVKSVHTDRRTDRLRWTTVKQYAPNLWIWGIKICQLSLYQRVTFETLPYWCNLQTIDHNYVFQMIILVLELIQDYWNRRQCWLPAFPPFPTMVSKVFLLWVSKSRWLCGKGFTYSRC